MTDRPEDEPQDGTGHDDDVADGRSAAPDGAVTADGQVARSDDAPADGDQDDAREGRLGSFPSLRSASSIFGEAKLPDNWPTRREIRAAERAASESGVVQPAPTAPVVPPPSPAPPATATPHPRSIELPTARSDRTQREAEARAVDEERRRTDPQGMGRDDVDWLGRATGPDVIPPVLADVPGVADVLPPDDEPPSFTQLLNTADHSGVRSVATPFDWRAATEESEPAEPEPVEPEPEAADSAPTTSGSWSLSADVEDVPTRAIDVPAELAGHEDELLTEPAAPVEEVPWWAQPDATPLPPTEAPPLVAPAADVRAAPGTVPPAVGHDLDAVLGIPRQIDPTLPTVTSSIPVQPQQPDAGRTARPFDPTDVDQSEWRGRETSDTRAIDALFGTGAMQSVDGHAFDEDALDEEHQGGFPWANDTATPAPAAARPAAGASGGGPGGENFVNDGFARLQARGRQGKRLLIWGAIAIIVVALIAVFFVTRWIVGNSPQDHTAPSTTPSAASLRSPTPSASSTPVAAPTASFATVSASVGTHPWTDLAGGECFSPYQDAWAETYAVVDCAAPHLAQLTLRSAIDAATWPGAAALRAQIGTLCSGSSAIALGAAAPYTDIQMQGAYPATQAEWDAGDHYSYCFVSRSSGQTITGSLAPTA